MSLTPHDCPQFNICNAAICPLDPLWKRAVHLKGEKVCHYLLSAAKPGATVRFAGDEVFAACQLHRQAICAKHSLIAYAVAKASKSGFKGDHLRAA
jgi:hypothetical protein